MSARVGAQSPRSRFFLCFRFFDELSLSLSLELLLLLEDRRRLLLFFFLCDLRRSLLRLRVGRSLLVVVLWLRFWCFFVRLRARPPWLESESDESLLLSLLLLLRCRLRLRCRLVFFEFVFLSPAAVAAAGPSWFAFGSRAAAVVAERPLLHTSAMVRGGPA